MEFEVVLNGRGIFLLYLKACGNGELYEDPKPRSEERVQRVSGMNSNHFASAHRPPRIYARLVEFELLKSFHMSLSFAQYRTTA